MFGLTWAWAQTPAPWKAFDIVTGNDNSTKMIWLTPDNGFVVWNITDGGQNNASAVFNPIPSWTPTRLGVDGDGLTRLLLKRTDGAVAIWTLGANLSFGSSTPAYGPYSGSTCVDMAVARDGSVRLLWTTSSGAFGLWNISPGGVASYSPTFGPYGDASGTWSASKVGMGGDGCARILLRRSNGQSAIWTMDGAMNLASSSAGFGPYTGFSSGASALALNTSASSDNKRHALWKRDDGQFVLWKLSPNDALTVPSALEVNATFGPYTNITAQALSVGGDGQMRVLLNYTDGRAVFWKLSPDGQQFPPPVNSTFGPLPQPTPTPTAPPPPPTPLLSVANASVNEGNSGTTPLPFVVSLSSASTQNVTFSYATAAGTATADTDYVSASGTGTIAAGQTSATIPVSVNGDTTVEPDETLTLTLSNIVGARLASGTTVSATGTIVNDDIGPTPTPAPVQRGVDLIVGSGAALVGENIFYPDAQLQTVNTAPNTPAVFRLIVKNTGNAEDTFRLSGRGDTPGWKVVYFDAASAGNDVSALVKSNGYLVTIAAGTSRELRIEVTPDGTVAQNQAKDVPVSVRSEGDSLYSDQVTARAVQNGVQPTPAPSTFGVDGAIRLASTSTYSGIGTTSLATQTLNGTASSGIAATYNWRIQNKGTASDTFKLSLPASVAGWNVRLFDALDGGTDVTTAAQSAAGYVTPSLAPDAFVELRLEVQPSAGTTGTLSTLLTAASVGDATKTDVCQTNTSVGSVAASPTATFTGTTRACAGSINNALHKLTLTLNATQNGTAMAGTFALSFENNVGHNYGTAGAPNIPNRAKIFDPNDTVTPWKETLNVTTGSDGQVTMTVLSSDVISQPRLIARWTNAGQTSTIGGVKCDFAAATSKRGFADPVTGIYPGWENDDTGWTCDFGALQQVGDTTQAKLYMKFQDSTGVFQPVVGHQITIRVGQLNSIDGSQVFDADEAALYLTFMDGSTERNQVTVVTDVNGIATVTVKAKASFENIRSMALAGKNTSQWVK